MYLFEVVQLCAPQACSILCVTELGLLHRHQSGSPGQHSSIMKM